MKLTSYWHQSIAEKKYFFKIVVFSFVVFLHSFYLAAASSVNIVLPMCIRILATFMFPAKNKTS